MALGADSPAVLGSLGAIGHPRFLPLGHMLRCHTEAHVSFCPPGPCPAWGGGRPSPHQPLGACPIGASVPTPLEERGRGGRLEACSRRLVPKAFSGCSADGPRPGDEPLVSFLPREQGPGAYFPTTIPLIQQLLNATELTQDPAAYSKLVAVLVYTAERAKFATGGERQDWMELFIDTFKLVHRDIMGDPETALALC